MILFCKQTWAIGKQVCNYIPVTRRLTLSFLNAVEVTAAVQQTSM